MILYVWAIDDKTVSDWDKILIKKGENVRIIMFNNSMMRHPMHLHGHDFRVINGQGEYAPLKNVIDIMPMETDTLEFAATESGDWFFHCHILYHMMSGMGNVFSYVNSPPNPDLPDANSEARIDSKGKLRFQLMREDIPLTSRLRAKIMGNTDKEYMGGLRYALSKYFALSTHYDSDMGQGVGVTFVY